MILLDGSIPIKYGLRLNSDSRYSDLKKELSTLCELHSSLMLVCELSNSQIRCSLPDGQKLKVSTATDLFVYEIPKGDFWKIRQNSEVVLNIEQGLKDIQRNPGESSNISFHCMARRASLSSFELSPIISFRSLLTAFCPIEYFYLHFFLRSYNSIFQRQCGPLAQLLLPSHSIQVHENDAISVTLISTHTNTERGSWKLNSQYWS